MWRLASMRLDKYLKVTHLIKRRGQAKDYIDAGYAMVDGRLAKPATDVEVGSVISLGDRDHPKMVVEVLQVRNFCSMGEVEQMYKVIKSDGAD